VARAYPSGATYGRFDMTIKIRLDRKKNFLETNGLAYLTTEKVFIRLTSEGIIKSATDFYDFQNCQKKSFLRKKKIQNFVKYETAYSNKPALSIEVNVHSS
jgi:hypothetical protein